jgi:hypothetical protein
VKQKALVDKRLYAFVGHERRQDAFMLRSDLDNAYRHQANGLVPVLTCRGFYFFKMETWLDCAEGLAEITSRRW